MSELDGWEDTLGDLLSPGDVVAEKYRVDRLIGTGGMGIVVEAMHLHFEERVAIKFLLPQMGADDMALARFEREARAAYKIKSEHVARVLDVGKLDGDDVPFMVMEYLEGFDLAEQLEEREPLEVEVAIEYVIQAIDAVAEAHVLGIVHRDLKPENLFVTQRADGSPCIKVLDFGLSKVALSEGEQETRKRAITATAQAMGTPQYMSPEQWMSARDVQAPTDQWALGIILFELLTGHQPFTAQHLAQLCTQVLRNETPKMHEIRDDLPDALQRVVERALAKEPTDRYSHLGDLAIDLAPFAPDRARPIIKRIVGVFRRAGLEVGELPSSRRNPDEEGRASRPHPPRPSFPRSTPDKDEHTVLMSPEMMEDDDEPATMLRMPDPAEAAPTSQAVLGGAVLGRSTLGGTASGPGSDRGDDDEDETLTTPADPLGKTEPHPPQPLPLATAPRDGPTQVLLAPPPPPPPPSPPFQSGTHGIPGYVGGTSGTHAVPNQELNYADLSGTYAPRGATPRTVGGVQVTWIIAAALVAGLLATVIVIASVSGGDEADSAPSRGNTSTDQPATGGE